MDRIFRDSRLRWTWWSILFIAIATFGINVIIFTQKFRDFLQAPLGQTRPQYAVSNLVNSAGHLDRIFEVDGLQVGLPFSIDVADAAQNGDPVSLMAELDWRHQNIAQVPLANDLCSADFAHLRALASRIRSPTISFAMNLVNNQEILPPLSQTLIHVLSLLAPDHTLYLSMFENGSNDQTPLMIGELAAALYATGVQGIWAQKLHLNKEPSGDRIIRLSESRNEALRPLLPHLDTGTFVFINDIVTCPEDILQLLVEREAEEADVAFGTDWAFWEDHIQYYDIWVARGINGNPVYPMKNSGFNPQSPNNDWAGDLWVDQDSAVHESWLNGCPIPVYSGWGGMAAFDTSLFTDLHLRFRSSLATDWTVPAMVDGMGAWGNLLNEVGYLDTDCPGASECEYINRDIWNLRNASARIITTPQARAAYSVKDWRMVEEQVRYPHDCPRSSDAPYTDWASVSPPETVVCMASRDRLGNRLDIFGSDNPRYRLPPIHTTQ